MGYYQKEIDRVLAIKPYGDRYRIKVTGYKEDGAGDETRWLSITPSELKRIRRILNRQ